MIQPQRTEREEEQEGAHCRDGGREQAGTEAAEPRRQRHGWIEGDERERAAPDRAQLVSDEERRKRREHRHDIGERPREATFEAAADVSLGGRRWVMQRRASL